MIMRGFLANNNAPSSPYPFFLLSFLYLPGACAATKDAKKYVCRVAHVEHTTNPIKSRKQRNKYKHDLKNPPFEDNAVWRAVVATKQRITGNEHENRGTRLRPPLSGIKGMRSSFPRYGNTYGLDLLQRSRSSAGSVLVENSQGQGMLSWKTTKRFYRRNNMSSLVLHYFAVDGYLTFLSESLAFQLRGVA